jgi:hypothetical protein
MSAKPTIGAVWGTDPTAHLAEPGTARRALGFGIGERPLDGHFNQLLHEVSLVSEYVLDGAFTPSIKSPAYLTDTEAQYPLAPSAFAQALPYPAGGGSFPIDFTHQGWSNFTDISASIALPARAKVVSFGVYVRAGSTGFLSDGTVTLYAVNSNVSTTIGTITIPSAGANNVPYWAASSVNYTVPVSSSASSTVLVLRLTNVVNRNWSLYQAYVGHSRPVF